MTNQSNASDFYDMMDSMAQCGADGVNASHAEVSRDGLA
jgi:hypothetical protein